MKHKSLLCLSLLAFLGLTSCGGGKNSSPSTTPIVNLTPSTLEQIKSAELGSVNVFEGVVVQHVYTGQDVPYITGMMVANDSGCIYVYGQNTAQQVKVGDQVKVSGKKAYYVPKTDSGAATSSGYKGQLQLTEPNLISHEKDKNLPIPENAITKTDELDPILHHSLTDDISNKIWQMKGRITKTIGGDYTNYYLWDLNRTDNINFYTQSNGKDYKWLEPYVDKSVNMTFISINAKPGNAIWRALPVKVNEEVTVTDQEEANYAAKRAEKTILSSYGDAVDVQVSNKDELLDGVTLKYECSNPLVTITQNETGYNIHFDKAEKPQGVEIKITATYKEKTASVTKSINLGNVPEYTATPIADALKLETGTEVTIEGIVGRKTYKGGTTDPLGAFIIDASGSIVVYNSAPFMASLSEVTEGNRVVLKGTIDRYISNDTVKNTGYTGDVQLKDTTLIYNAAGQNEVPSDAIEEKTITWISSQPVSNNISSRVFKVQAKIKKSTGYATSYSLLDPADESKSLSVYSQRSGSDFAWLDEYENKVVVLYVGVQNLQIRSGNPNWRSCPIQILNVVE